MKGSVTIERRRRYRRGLMAEWIALLYFAAKGYRFVAWRYKTPVGEIDLIVRRGKTLVFVEVKARTSREEAAFAVHGRNQSRVVRAAQYFLTQHPRATSYQVRFDVCLIAWYRWPHHIADAFQPTFI
jgi:putative endonuclease